MKPTLRPFQRLTVALLVVGALTIGVAQRAAAAPVAQLASTMVEQDALIVKGVFYDETLKAAGTELYVVVTGLGASYRFPIARRTASAEVAAALAPTGGLTTQEAALFNAGFYAAADISALPPGAYSVTSVEGKFGTQTVSAAVSSPQSTFTVTDNITDTVVLTDAQGSPVAVTAGRVAGVSTLKGYPSLRDGLYTLTASLRNKYGLSPAGGALAVTYQRPIQPVSVSVPMVENFPAVARRVGIINPLTNAYLQGTLSGKARLTGGTASVATVNGVSVTATDTTIPIAVLGTGHGINAVVASGTSTVDVWIDAPDAPTLRVGVNTWNPDAGITLAASRANATYARAVEPVSVTIATDSGVCSGIADGTNFVPTTTYDQPICSVRYTQLPSGLDRESSGRIPLAGYIPDLGPNLVAYDTGVLFTNTATNTTSFYRASSKQLALIGTPPPAPTVTFVADQATMEINRNAVEPSLFSFIGDVIAGRAEASASYPGLTLAIKVAGNTVRTSNSSSTSAREFIQTQLAQLYSTQTFDIEASYTRLPEVKTVKTLTFTGLPRKPSLVVTNAVSVSTSDAVMSGLFGASSYGASGQIFTYDPGVLGTWSVKLAAVASNGTETAMGSPVTAISATGAWQANLGQLAPGTYTIIARANLAGPAGSNTTSLEVKSLRASLLVKNGSDINATLTTRAATGPTPFSPTIGLSLANNARYNDIGRVDWTVSDDGATYVPMLVAGAAATGTSVRPTFATAGKRWIKAKIINRNNEDDTNIDPIEVQAFDISRLAINGPTATFVARPVTLTASSLNSVPTDYTWSVQKGSGDRSPTTHTGETLTLTPEVAADWIIRLEGAQTGAPVGDPNRLSRATTILRVTAPLIQKASLNGSRTVEAGKSYSYNATRPSLFLGSLQSNMTVSGRWLLPNGQTQDGDTLSYTPTATDKFLRYEAWVTEMPTVRSVAELPLSVWAYAWPAWSMQTRVLDNRVPARVRYTVAPSDLRQLSALGREPISYSWTVPANATVVESRDNYATVEFAVAGQYQITSTVSDTRGNAIQAYSDIVEVLPPLQLTGNITLTHSDRWERAPSRVSARVVITTLPRSDNISNITYKVDGVQVAQGLFTTVGIDVPSAGTHNVDAIVSTVNGQTMTLTQPITLVTGDNPVCSIAKNGTIYSARCTVTKGYVSTYRWTVNGQTMPVSGGTMSLTAAQAATATSVTVTAVTDKGQEGTGSL